MRGGSCCARGRPLPVLARSTPAWADDGEPRRVTFHKGQIGISARLGARGPRRSRPTRTRSTAARPTPTAAARLRAGLHRPDAARARPRGGLRRRPTHRARPSSCGSASRRTSARRPSSDGPRAVPPRARRAVLLQRGQAHASCSSSPQVVFDFAGYAAGGNDFGVRGIEGFWIDLHRAYGALLLRRRDPRVLAVAVRVVRGGIGFQGRYP